MARRNNGNSRNGPKKQHIGRQAEEFLEALAADPDISRNLQRLDEELPASNSGQRNAKQKLRKTSSEIEYEIERLLGNSAIHRSVLQRVRPSKGTSTALPEWFRQAVEEYRAQGMYGDKVARYYLEAYPRGDSSAVPGQGGRVSLLQDILRQDTQSHGGTGWRPKRSLGKGGWGQVILWEKPRKHGPVSPLS